MNPADTPHDALLRHQPPEGGRTALTVLATLAVIVALWWGRSFMIPLTAGVMLALLATPIAAVFERWVRSRIAATTLTLLLVTSAMALAAAAFGDQLTRVAGRVPDMITLVAHQVSDTGPGADSVMKRAREAFRRLDRAAERLSGFEAPPAPVLRGRLVAPALPKPAAAAASAVEAPPTTISQTAGVAFTAGAVTGSGFLFKLAADLTIVLFIAFFLLAGGKPLANRFLELWGDRPGLRLRAEHAAVECVRQIHIYAGVLLVTNVGIGIVVWAAFSYAQLPDARGWGLTAALLHIVPYIGMALLTGLGAAEAYLVHGTVSAAVGMAGFLVVMSTITGTVVTAWLQSRAAKMNASAVFIGVVFWGALWGLWGLLLGPALVVVMKVIAEHTRPGQRLAHLMQG